MKRIKLTQGQVALVDDEDFVRFGHLKWYAFFNRLNKSHYAGRNIPILGGKQTRAVLHREIMGNPPGKEVDHWNHNTLDNRRENLRICTHMQNCQNRNGAKRTSGTGLRGVSHEKRRGGNRWKAVICVNGKRIYLGMFRSPQAASDAYADANKEHFGEFGGKI